MATFNIGDRITIDSAVGYKGGAEILALRHAIGNHRTGQLSFGCDVLRDDGRTTFYFLADVARWNAERLHKPEPPAVLVDVLKEALSAWPGSFDGDAEINGGDLVEWFSEWRLKAHDALKTVGVEA